MFPVLTVDNLANGMFAHLVFLSQIYLLLAVGYALTYVQHIGLRQPGKRVLLPDQRSPMAAAVGKIFRMDSPAQVLGIYAAGITAAVSSLLTGRTWPVRFLTHNNMNKPTLCSWVVGIAERPYRTSFWRTGQSALNETLMLSFQRALSFRTAIAPPTHVVSTAPTFLLAIGRSLAAILFAFIHALKSTRLLMLFNPFGLRVMPRVYSPDLPRHRQVWHA